MVPFFNLTKQYNVIKSEIDEATARVMKKGCFILGLEVAAFEKNYLYPFSVNQLPNAIFEVDGFLVSYIPS
jgi:hypothetical protein